MSRSISLYIILVIVLIGGFLIFSKSPKNEMPVSNTTHTSTKQSIQLPSSSPTFTSTPKPTEQSFEGIKCGNATPLGQCPSGYKCVPDPSITGQVGDVPGICAKE